MRVRVCGSVAVMACLHALGSTREARDVGTSTGAMFELWFAVVWVCQ